MLKTGGEFNIFHFTNTSNLFTASIFLKTDSAKNKEFKESGGKFKPATLVWQLSDI